MSYLHSNLRCESPERLRGKLLKSLSSDELNCQNSPIVIDEANLPEKCEIDFEINTQVSQKMKLHSTTTTTHVFTSSGTTKPILKVSEVNLIKDCFF